MTKGRIPYVDFGSGVMILWVILYHALSDANEIVFYGLYNNVTDISLLPQWVHAYIAENGRITPMLASMSFPYLHFFMPWFFYKSGQFFLKRDTKTLVNKDSAKYLRPFIIYSIAGYVIYLVFLLVNSRFSFFTAFYKVLKIFFFNGYIELNLPLWFLLTILGVRFVANIVLPNKEDKYLTLKCLLIVFVCCVVAYAVYCWNSRFVPYWIGNGVSGLMFFTLGYSLAKYETKWWLLIPCIAINIACIIWGFPIVDMFSNRVLQGSYLLNKPVCFAGIVVFNVLCRFGAQYLPAVSSQFEKIAQYGMIIYVSHGLLYLAVGNILYSFELTNLMPYSLWLILGSYIVFLPLFCYIHKMHLLRTR